MQSTAGLMKIGHVFLAISPKRDVSNKITSEIAGYFAEKFALGAFGAQ